MFYCQISIVLFSLVFSCKNHSGENIILNQSANVDTDFISQCGKSQDKETQSNHQTKNDDLDELVKKIMLEKRKIAGSDKNENIKKSCVDCHGRGNQDIVGYGDFSDIKSLKDFIDSENPNQTTLLKAVTPINGVSEMPPNGEDTLSEKELTNLRNWVIREIGAKKNIARDHSSVNFISVASKNTCIFIDVNNHGDDAEFYRYFDLTSLHNANLLDELTVARKALNKLANSLSWKRTIKNPIPIDPESTLYRIDLRWYGWSKELWREIQNVNPYAQSLTTHYSSELFKRLNPKDRALPIMRGDWFVARASQSPLYEKILDLPNTESKLEEMLLGSENSVATNIDNFQAHRIGMRPLKNSPTLDNRVLERHESRSGYYWKSYDFGSSTNEQNIFERPLGPKGQFKDKGVENIDDFAFSHDGAEIIFSLPNGLQGYYISKADGQFLAKAPNDIVQHPLNRRHNFTVFNGYSCMACHTNGIIKAKDKVRSHILDINAYGTTKRWQDEKRRLVEKIYRDDINSLILSDQRVFEQSLNKTNNDAREVETVFSTLQFFEQDLQLNQVAAEFGLTTTDFIAFLNTNPEVKSRLAINEPVGRNTLANNFAKISRLLGGGEGTVLLNQNPASFSKEQLKCKPEVLSEYASRQERWRVYINGSLISPDRQLNYLTQSDCESAINQQGHLKNKLLCLPITRYFGKTANNTALVNLATRKSYHNYFTRCSTSIESYYHVEKGLICMRRDIPRKENGIVGVNINTMERFFLSSRPNIYNCTTRM